MNYRIKILGVLMPFCLFLCFISNTYSRYIADTTGNLKLSFAQWQILVNNDDITNSSSSSVVLNPVIAENKYVKTNKIAPSSNGYFDINIDPSNVDVSFNYSISIDVINENIPDLVITKYAILDSDYKDNEIITYNNIENNLIKGSMDIENISTNSDDIENNKFKSFIVRVCFEWYEGQNEEMNDEADTLIGNDTVNNNLEINAQIKFEQKLEAN